jgi:SNF family Na+-dependent transporter
MKYLQYQWKSRLGVVLIVSIVISAAMMMLEMTDFANQINQQGFSHGDGDGPSGPAALMFILPFVKEIILIGVPMLLALLVMKTLGRKKRNTRVRKCTRT